MMASSGKSMCKSREGLVLCFYNNLKDEPGSQESYIDLFQGQSSSDIVTLYEVPPLKGPTTFTA